jgi:PKHD-type hydroxylase
MYHLTMEKRPQWAWQQGLKIMVKLMRSTLRFKPLPTTCWQASATTRNRYSESQTYGYHVDAAIMRIPNTPDVLRSDMSMTVFLSSPSDYEGGELVIQTGFGEQKVKGNLGSAVLYPSSSLHKVTPVTRGERIAAITWMQSMISDQTIRESLYELDQSIQSLVQGGKANREELDKLHHVYHNLIRKFSIV